MKKVFIGVLAALMLFAFTACEPSTMKVVQETGNPLIAKATAVTSETYYEGDTLETTDYFTVALEYTNGGSAEVVAAVKTNATLKGGDNLVQVTLPQNQGDCYVVVSAIALNKELTVTLPADYKTTYTAEEYKTWAPSTTAPADPEKVELFYADGTLAKAFTKATTLTNAGEYTITWDSSTKDDIKNIKIIAKTGSEEADEIEYLIPLTIAKPAAEIDGIAVYYSVNGAEATATLGTVKYGDKVELSVWTVSDDKKVERVTDFEVLSNATWKNTVTVSDTDTYSVEIIYVADNGTVYEASAEVGTGSDYVASIKEVVVSEGSKPNMIPDTTFENADDFVVMGYMAKDSTKAVDVTDDVTLELATTDNTQMIPADAKAGDKVTIYLSVTLDGDTKVYPVDVTVVAKGV